MISRSTYKRAYKEKEDVVRIHFNLRASQFFFSYTLLHFVEIKFFY
jgi:hypothetical protein